MVWVQSIVAGLLALAVVGAVSRAHAGMEFGARLGYGIPMGKAADSSGGELSKGIEGMIPLQLDIGYRVIPSVSVGGYVMYGFGILGDEVKSDCDAAKDAGGTADCGIHDVRLGIQGQFHFSPGLGTDPWVGAGLGYEWLTVKTNESVGGLSRDYSLTLHGFEVLNLQAGLDFTLPVGLGVGPYASFSMARFDSTSASCSGAGCGQSGTASGDIEKEALHEWFIIGARGTFAL